MKNILIILLVILPGFLSAQDKNERLGIPEELKTGAFYFNYGDKDKANIDVFVWGYVRGPGKYLIPQGTSLVELLTLCGGPMNDTKLTDIRIVRLKNDSLGIKEDKVINLDYNDYLWEDKISAPSKFNPLLMPGDIIIFPQDQKYGFRDNLVLILSITSTLVSITTLIVTVLLK